MKTDDEKQDKNRGSRRRGTEEGRRMMEEFLIYWMTKISHQIPSWKLIDNYNHNHHKNINFNQRPFSSDWH